MPPALVLDLDGTLVDSVPDLAAALNRLAASRGFAPFDRATVTAMVGDGAHVLVTRAFAAWNAPFEETAFNAFLEDYTANCAVETRPFPGALETLGWFAEAGWRIAVCTNKPEKAARALLDALALTPFLTAIGGGDSFPTRKPDPGHLLGTLAAAGGRADAAIMVGDHANDVKTATGAGLPCIFAGWGYGPIEMAAGSAAIAQSFTDLPGLAETMLGR
jgi:phosphoglycolate phosphatase